MKHMRRATFSLLLALTLGAGMTPAIAGGDLVAPDYRTGINPYGVATPVPAPIPVPLYEAAWYFRGDFAAGFGGDPSVTATGTPFVGNTVGFSPTWISKSFEPSFTGGVGVGYVWGPRFRTDLTVDLHSIMEAKLIGSTPLGGGTLFVDDKTDFFTTILLANAYYDFRTGTPLTPYLGGGVGFAVNQMTRNGSSTYTPNPTFNTSVNGRRTDVQFAAAAMAGLTYDISSFVALDVNYRYLYFDGSDAAPTGANSTVSIGGLNEHQIRAGLRLYVY
jgi:opacity protein-like surface antigen